MKLEGKKRIWQDYQKEIPDDKYYYLRSCVRQNFFPGSETTFVRMLREELKKDLYENPAHTTCTGIGYHGDVLPLETTMTIVARQFALMNESGYENIVASCVTSFGIYLEVLDFWHHFPEVEEKIREYLRKATGREFEKPKSVVHSSDILYKFRYEIAKKANYKLVDKKTGEPLKVVEHIGCHYAKLFPSKSVGGAEYPYVLVGLIEAFGGEVVDYPERRHCCGFGFRQYLLMANRGYSIACSKKKFESMQPYEPDMIFCNCPGCPMFLDRWQYAIRELEGKTYGKNGHGIPVLTHEELAGIILGYDPWDIGLQVHQVPVEPLLDKIGIPYDKDKKYKGINGKDLGSPKNPTEWKLNK